MCQVFQNTAAGAMEALAYIGNYSSYGMIAAERDSSQPGVWQVHHIHNGSFGTSTVFLPGYSSVEELSYESDFK